MSEADRAGDRSSAPTGGSSPPTAGGSDSPASGDGYTGPGAWGPAALWLLGGLFVLSAIATIHSILVTFGG